MTAPLSLRDKQMQFLVGLYGPGLSYNDMLRQYYSAGTTKSITDAANEFWAGPNSLSDDMYTVLPGSGSLADKQYGSSSGGLVNTITNLVLNPTPASTTGWNANNAAHHITTYAAGEISVDRQAAASVNVAASYNNFGGISPANPVLSSSKTYQRSVEIWVDADAITTAGSGLPGGFTPGKALPANQWTRYVEQFTGSGVAHYVMNMGINITGVGTGIHVKFRKAFLAENPTGRELAYADGNSLGWSWNGTANNSTSKGPAIYEASNPPATTFKSSGGGKNDASSSVHTYTVPAGVVATDTIWLCYGWNSGTANTVTPSCTAGGTFTTIQAPRADNNMTWGIIAFTNLVAGNTMTITLGSSNGLYMSAFVFTQPLGVVGTVGSRGGVSQLFTNIPAATFGYNRGVLLFSTERSTTVANVSSITSTTEEVVTQLAYDEAATDPVISFYLGRCVSKAATTGPMVITYGTTSGNGAGMLIKEVV